MTRCSVGDVSVFVCLPGGHTPGGLMSVFTWMLRGVGECDTWWGWCVRCVKVNVVSVRSGDGKL